MPVGPENSAVLAGPSVVPAMPYVPESVATDVPTILRRVLLVVSETTSEPPGRETTPVGLLKRAAVVPSAVPDVPGEPATVDTVPELILRNV